MLEFKSLLQMEDSMGPSNHSHQTGDRCLPAPLPEVFTDPGRGVEEADLGLVDL